MTIKIFGFGVHDLLHHSGGGLAARVGKQGADTDVGNGHGVLIAAAFRRAHMDKLDPIAAQFAKFTDITGRYEGRNDQIMLEKIADPFGIFLVCLFAFDCLGIFRVGNTEIETRFEKVPDGDPIFACGLHRDIFTVIGVEPVSQIEKVMIAGAEMAHEILCDVGRWIGDTDRSDNDILVDIHTAAGWTNNTKRHKKKLLSK